MAVKKSAIHEELETLKNDLSELKTQYTSKIEEVDELIAELNSKKDQIKDFYADYFLTKIGDKVRIEKLRSIAEEIETSKEEIDANMEDIIKNIDIIEKGKDETEKYKQKLFGIQGKEKESLSYEIDSTVTKFKNLVVSSQKEHTALFDRIEGLLPGATATGLAKAYQEQKDSYKIPILAWSGVFLITTMFMIWFSIDSVKQAKDITTAFMNLLARVPFYVPAIWLALFASKQQSQYKRLEQEYANKESFAKSYMGFRREIESLDETDESEAIMQKFMTYLVEITAYNPSSTLDNKSHEDSPPLVSRLLDFGGKKEEKGDKDKPK